MILQIYCRQNCRIAESLPDRETAVCRVSPDFGLRGFSTVPAKAGRPVLFFIRIGETSEPEKPAERSH